MGELRQVAVATLVLVALTGAPSRAENVDPQGAGSQYAYGENVGWVNAEPLGDGGPGMQVGDFALSGYLWSENLGWISLSCQDTGSCGSVAYGVTNDGFGKLSGQAWAENAGWVSFAPTGAGVVVDPATGRMNGRAWSENAGWITFAQPNPPFAYEVATSWCQAVPQPPAGIVALTLTNSAGTTSLQWTALFGAGWYDVVRGDLDALRATGGSFQAATKLCLSSKGTATSVVDASTPPPGTVWFFLVRGSNCKGHGTYDGATQVAPRDPGITASGADCP